MINFDRYSKLLHSKHEAKLQILMNNLLNLLKYKYKVSDISYRDLSDVIFSKYLYSHTHMKIHRLLNNPDANEELEAISDCNSKLQSFNAEMNEIDKKISKTAIAIFEKLKAKSNPAILKFSKDCVTEALEDIVGIKLAELGIYREDYCFDQLSELNKKYLKKCFKPEDIDLARQELALLFQQAEVNFNKILEQAELTFATEPTQAELTFATEPTQAEPTFAIEPAYENVNSTPSAAAIEAQATIANEETAQSIETYDASAFSTATTMFSIPNSSTISLVGSFEIPATPPSSLGGSLIYPMT